MAKIDQIKTLLEKEPNDIFLNYSLAMAYRSAGQADDAISQLETTLTLDGHYLAAHMQMAELLIEQRRFDQAKAALDAARNIAHQSGDAHMLDNIDEMIESLP